MSADIKAHELKHLTLKTPLHILLFTDDEDNDNLATRRAEIKVPKKCRKNTRRSTTTITTIQNNASTVGSGV